MLARLCGEGNEDLWEERGAVVGHQVVPDGEDEPGGGRSVRVEPGQVGDAAVLAGHRAARRDPGAAGPDVEADRHPGDRPAGGEIEDVRGDGGHAVTSFRSLMSLILLISAAAASRSVAGS